MSPITKRALSKLIFTRPMHGPFQLEEGDEKEVELSHFFVTNSKALAIARIGHGLISVNKDSSHKFQHDLVTAIKSPTIAGSTS